ATSPRCWRPSTSRPGGAWWGGLASCGRSLQEPRRRRHGKVTEHRGSGGRIYPRYGKRPDVTTQSTTADAALATGSKGLSARVLGVLFAPRATYADVAARPRWLGAFLVVVLVRAAAVTTFMSTETERNAVVDQQIPQAEAW